MILTKQGSPGRRTVVIGLDAFEPTIARALIAEARLPNLARLIRTSARFDLDPGPERFTGLAWHQFSTGLHPTKSERWSAIHFDPRSYNVHQPDTDEPAFVQDLEIKTVAVDVPHFKLSCNQSIRGIANWGCHDAGVPRATNPPELMAEIRQRFGPYPAEQFIYGIVWADPQLTRIMGEQLAQAVETRRRIAVWLLRERIPDWDLAIVSVAEFHSVIETMWHGWDALHPLHSAPSGEGARAALVGVYEAGDRLVGDLIDAFPDSTIVTFAHHGMGSNTSDASAMILMAELLHRASLGQAALDIAEDAAKQVWPEYFDWSDWVNARLTAPEESAPARWLPWPWGGRHPSKAVRSSTEHLLDWMPTARYRRAWPRMRAFAIPSYHDARIRLNVKGREARGMVRRRDYRRTLEEIRDLVLECVDLATGMPLEVAVEFAHPDDPSKVNPWQADVMVRFKGNTLGLRHLRLGVIGPVPHRRTGGHTGGFGVAYIAGPGIVAGDYGVASTFDVVPLIRDLVRGGPPRSPMGIVLTN